MDDATYAGLYVVFTDASGLEWKYRVGTQQFSKATREVVWIGEGALRHKGSFPEARLIALPARSRTTACAPPQTDVVGIYPKSVIELTAMGLEKKINRMTAGGILH